MHPQLSREGKASTSSALQWLQAPSSGHRGEHLALGYPAEVASPSPPVLLAQLIFLAGPYIQLPTPWALLVSQHPCSRSPAGPQPHSVMSVPSSVLLCNPAPRHFTYLLSPSSSSKKLKALFNCHGNFLQSHTIILGCCQLLFVPPLAPPTFFFLEGGPADPSLPGLVTVSTPISLCTLCILSPGPAPTL